MIKEIYNFLLKIFNNLEANLWGKEIKFDNYQDFTKSYLDFIDEKNQPVIGALVDFYKIITANSNYGFVGVRDLNNFLNEIITEFLKDYTKLEAEILQGIIPQKCYDYFNISPNQNLYLDNILKNIFIINNPIIEQKESKFNLEEKIFE
ncbi:hypothetical protein P344_02830 [Spiroplasma mirum ATCC 29335]|uniref:Uncharacterized protein n=1 Tax=Spiroplasma mirum ATCC 29335 TaxID=838561 RepID=W0GQT1_9MOLU|nr:MULTISPECIES: hypothetical protein [Spiroplasma]AHF60906.1 hypothetical protein SMM_0473 [Spiroplasma mirum ATCC 29335]AHI57911.1 hypothetical protein P344_02830 [Spiroplasma mirum ATCC 29335]AKM53021.1 hypothetical protein SATRI_v1c05330 [Spiroplasma atrichopogonis]